MIPEGSIKQWPIITEDDEKAVINALRSGALWGRSTPEVKKLQKEWAKYVGVEHCVMTQSGTAALHMAIAAAGIGPGDEVITSAFTYIATPASVLHHNAIPVFVDINQFSFNIDINKIEEKITKRTKAIIPVHMHGMPADMEEIQHIANKYDLKIIEDACQAHGALYRGKKVGSLGDIGCFSLNGSKNLSAGGEGGLLVTDSDHLFNRAKAVGMFGEVDVGRQRIRNSDYLGWMYRSQELPATIARCQLKRLDSYNAKREKNCEFLAKHLGEIPGIEIYEIPNDRKHVYFMFCLKFNPNEAGYDMSARHFREAVEKALFYEGVMIGQAEKTPVMGHDVFQRKVGYGKGCPWSCSYYAEDIIYNENDYPNAQKFCDEHTLIWGYHPPNNIDLMTLYVDAFYKVFGQLDRAIQCSKKQSTIPTYQCDLFGAVF